MQVQHVIKAVSSHLFNGLSNWYDIKSKTELESDVEGFYWETVESKRNNTEGWTEELIWNNFGAIQNLKAWFQ